jgi:hypothetical protein
MRLTRDIVGAMVMLSAVIGCAGPDERPGPTPSQPLDAALASLGSATLVEGREGVTGEVVLIKDRHAVGPGIFQVDEKQRAFHREQRAVVGHLVARGFTLLGCEHTLGPLPRNAAADDHLAVIARAKADGDDVNGWSVFQPLRYEVELQGRLTVLGVEDPDLYQQDLDTLAQIEKTLRVASDREKSGLSAKALSDEETRLRRKITANVGARGAAAARNLVAAMRERGVDKAILMLGASHVPGASAELQAAGVRHWVFEAPGFRRRPGE